jgi:hypothetical protein
MLIRPVNCDSCSSFDRSGLIAAYCIFYLLELQIWLDCCCETYLLTLQVEFFFPAAFAWRFFCCFELAAMQLSANLKKTEYFAALRLASTISTPVTNIRAQLSPNLPTLAKPCSASLFVENDLATTNNKPLPSLR